MSDPLPPYFTADEKLVTRKSILSGYLWVGGGVLVSQSILWVITLWVARLLEPRDYGLVGMAGVFLSLCRVIQDSGLRGALVQRRDLDSNTLQSAFLFSLALGAAGAGVVWAIAPLVALIYKQPQVIPVMQVLSIGFLLASAKAVPGALLSKSLAFKQRTQSEVISAVSGALITLGMAYSGFGVWSLILGRLSGDTIQLVMLSYFSPWHPFPSLRWRFRELVPLLKFGLPHTGASLLWRAYNQADFFVVGFFSGPTALGFYGMGWQLSNVLNEKLHTVLNKVNFPTYAALQGNIPRAAAHWLQTVEAVAWVTFPAMAGLALVANSFIGVILTAKWLPAVPILQVLCMMTAMSSQAITIPPILTALGHPGKNFIQNIFAAALLVPAIVIGALLGDALGVAIASALVYPLILAARVRVLLKVVDLRLADYTNRLLPPLTIAVMMAVAVYAVGLLPVLKPAVKLAMQVGLGAALYGTVAWFWLRKTGRLAMLKSFLRPEKAGEA